jgi:hypothetical protein
MSSPKMNLFVILAMNTQIFSGRGPWVSGMNNFRLMSHASHRFLPSSHRGSLPGNCLAPHGSSMPTVFDLFAWLGALGSPKMSWRSFRFGLAARSTVCSLTACL